ncbi:predicted protein [Nematostella vectensis]|uniref:Uncharacterized protein n=1 Tax=Nematostella vectensis TaxID=45351 RepID=A7SU59_NEMVE|nr:predicted protein [Nematostella vectensis]|eukprot:XP_001624867.1 predicted protein [Nematostella vectensis]
MGVSRINSMMKNLIHGTNLKDNGKKFTNHSARNTLVGKLKKASVERSGIARVTGHRNPQSVDDYDEGDEEEQCELFHANSKPISGIGLENQLLPVPSTSRFGFSRNEDATLAPEFTFADQQIRTANVRPQREVLQNSPSIQQEFSSSQMSSAARVSMGAQVQTNTFHHCAVHFNFTQQQQPASTAQFQVRKRRNVIESDSDDDLME